jgi:glycerol-3-phosphate acyltransferase PlsY
LGCYSTAKLLAESSRSLNLYKIGSGLADTENIYNNVSKPLGVLCGLIDIGKVYLYLNVLKLLFNMFRFSDLSSETMIFVFGFFMIAGHCLPMTSKFKGGRGIFTYIGLIGVFMPYQMICLLFLAGYVVVIYKQYRFVQYMIVMLPPILSFFWNMPRIHISLMFITAVLMGVLNIVLSKRLGEI